jgi:hypothetical protein
MADHEILELAKKIRYDLTALQAKTSELLQMAARLEPPAPPIICPECQLPFKGPKTLAEHRYQQHDGPLPEHWATAEERAAL